MAWLKFDDQFPDHPKVVAAGPFAAWLYVCGIAYSSRHLTDGFVPAAAVSRLADFEAAGVKKTLANCDRLATILCENGLWHEVDGGYVIHDYDAYQPSKQDVLQVRAARSEKARHAAITRWNKQKAA